MGNANSSGVNLQAVPFPANRGAAVREPVAGLAAQAASQQQQGTAPAPGAVDEDCDACSDGPGGAYVPGVDANQADGNCMAYMHSGCKLNRRELGRAAWGYLHTMAVYYPENPTPRQQDNMRTYLELTAEMYPCTECAKRSVEEIERNPPRVESRNTLTEWMCEFHNEVNERLGAPIFQCNEYLNRWRMRSCDEPEAAGSKN